jgi:hypothetical protein
MFDIRLVETDPRVVILLERKVTGQLPGYPVHGEVRCQSCHITCWLDVHAMRVVLEGKATPQCIECGRPHVTQSNIIGVAADM